MSSKSNGEGGERQRNNIKASSFPALKQKLERKKPANSFKTVY